MNNQNNGVMRIAKSRAEARRRTGARLDAGFGTMDVLIAVLIMGVLSAITITALGGMLGKARVASCQSDGQTISTAIDAFNAENPGQTVTSTDLTSNVLDGTSTNDGGPFLQSFPVGSATYMYWIDGQTGFNAPSGATISAPSASVGQAGQLLIWTDGTTNTNGGWAVFTDANQCSNIK